MAMNLTCLNTSLPLPLVPMIANGSSTAVHPSYKPNSGGLAQLISSSIVDSTFSIDDVRSLIKTLYEKNIGSWTTSEITQIKPILSIIIYSSIALALFLILSVTFCIVSCRNSSHRGRKRKQSKTTRVFVCLLIIVYLLGIGDMIYVAHRVNQSKVSIDDTIKQVNRDIYPKEISEHIIYLIKQIENLDQYCVQPNSILINASKSILVKTFNEILTEKYLIQSIAQSVNRIDKNIQNLTMIVDDDPSISQLARVLFQRTKEEYQNMIDSLQNPIKKVCDYATGTQTDIDKKLLEALERVHRELGKIIDTIKKDILNGITPWQNNMLMNTDLEEQIRGYINLVGTIFLILVICLAIIPLSFAILIILSRLCSCDRSEPSKNNQHFPLNDVSRRSQVSSMKGHSNSETHHPRKNSPRQSVLAPEYPNKSPSCVLPCLMRIAFFVMIIMLIIMVILTGGYYALNLSVQGACRAAHDDQPFWVSFIIDKVIQPNTLYINGTGINTTVLNIINDCRDGVHFSGRLIGNFWPTLDREIKDMMNELNGQIYEQFKTSIDKINIPDDIKLLTEFATAANRPAITNKVNDIDRDLNIIQTILANITDAKPILPQSLIQNTTDEFNDYVKQVLESTIDSCPLPLATIYKADTLVCHTMGGSINGLWLSVFIFMFLITAGLCIFGICVYKRLN